MKVAVSRPPPHPRAGRGPCHKAKSLKQTSLNFYVADMLMVGQLSKNVPTRAGPLGITICNPKLAALSRIPCSGWSLTDSATLDGVITKKNRIPTPP
eukprot:jgi/Botrbrau1/17824/Bobra.0127s0069.1